MRTIAGLDLCDDVSQISVAVRRLDGDIEVDTLPVEVGSEKYCIHTCAMKLKERDEWLFGEEAYRTPAENGFYFDKLLSLALSLKSVKADGQEYETISLLSRFIRSTLRGVPLKADWPDKPVLYITLKELTPDILNIMKKAVERAELENVEIRFLNHSESCFYYTASQNQQLKLHKVCLLDYDGRIVTTSMLNTNRLMRPNVTFIEERTFELPIKDDLEMLNICREVMDSEIISSVYLAGTGFDGNWANETVRYICQKGRRVFQGMNLYTKGACYAALDVTGMKNITGSEIFLDKDKLIYNIGIELNSRGVIKYVSLIEAGINWFEASSELEFMLGQGADIRILLIPINGEGQRCIVIRTDNIPERPERASRVRLSIQMLSESELKCTVTDLGFGEIFPASGNETEEVINLKEL